MAAAASLTKIIKLLAIVLLCVKFCLCDLNDYKPENKHTAIFDVRPGGTKHSHDETWKDITCTFTYICQGGTSEEWTVEMTENGSEFTCSVKRQSSYLFFLMFEMQITGGLIKEAHALGENGKELPPSEYTLDNGTNTVKQVDGNFQSHLTEVVVYGTSAKQEL